MFSPYSSFSRKEWLNFRKETPDTLSQYDLENLQSPHEPISHQEIREIYLPLSRLLNLHVCATQVLHQARNDFLGKSTPKVPYIIGVAGSVAVGKSTTSRVLQALLSRWPHHPKVSLITTDGFLYSQAELETRGLLNKKGFPESYNLRALLDFLASIKSGNEHICAPVYSHKLYDIIPHESIELTKADIVIVEGLNILQTGPTEAGAFVSDFFDFTIFVDAETTSIKEWFIERVRQFRKTVFQDPEAYFHFITKMSEQETLSFCEDIWRDVNEKNLIENILPFKNRARLILFKGRDHAVQRIFLRKI